MDMDAIEEVIETNRDILDLGIQDEDQWVQNV